MSHDVVEVEVAAEKVAQLGERTEFTHGAIGNPQHDSILAADVALQQAGVIVANEEVRKSLDELVN